MRITKRANWRGKSLLKDQIKRQEAPARDLAKPAPSAADGNDEANGSP